MQGARPRPVQTYSVQYVKQADRAQRSRHARIRLRSRNLVRNPKPLEYPIPVDMVRAPTVDVGAARYFRGD